MLWIGILFYWSRENDCVSMHYEKFKTLMKRSLWCKEKLFFKDKSFWSSVMLKIKLLMEAYVKKLSDICF